MICHLFLFLFLLHGAVFCKKNQGKSNKDEMRELIEYLNTDRMEFWDPPQIIKNNNVRESKVKQNKTKHCQRKHDNYSRKHKKNPKAISLLLFK